MDEPLEEARARLAGKAEPKRVLGRGAWGLVVEAEWKGRRVAVKLLAPELIADATNRARLLREAKLAAAVEHPGVLEIHEVDEAGAFIVMELVEGTSLADHLAIMKRLEPAEVRRVGRVLLGALAAVHSRGILHRDVKPSNILLGKNQQVKLGDFGVAKSADAKLTDTGASVGTPAYAAPEQLRGHADMRSDLYGLGATLFEAATGTPLHSQDRWIADRKKHVLDATGDERLAAALARAVEERPEDRFATADDFLVALDGDTRPRPQRLVRVAVASLVLALGAAGLWGARVFRARPPAPTPAAIALADGGAKLRADRLEEALPALLLAQNGAPNDARIHHDLAFAYWWGNRDDSEVLFHVSRAKALGIGPAGARFLDGVALLLRHDDAAVDFFERAAREYASSDDLRYGLFEALFHSGHCRESAREYQILIERARDWRLGAFHVASFAVAQRDQPLFDAISAHAGYATEPKQAGWALRWQIAEGDYTRALEAAATEPELALSAHLLSLDIEGAEAMVAAADPPSIADLLSRYGMATLRARPRDEARTALVSEIERTVVGGDNLELRIQLAIMEAALGEPRGLADLHAQTSSVSSDPRVAMAELVAPALLSRPLPKVVTTHLEVRALATALSATDASERTRAFEEAVSHSCDGRFAIVSRFLRAKDARAEKDHAAVLEACGAVIHPRVFRWTWAALAPACLTWSAEAARALRRPEDAARFDADLGRIRAR